MSKYINLLIAHSIPDELLDFTKERYRQKCNISNEKADTLRSMLSPEVEKAYLEAADAAQNVAAEEADSYFAAGVKFGINLLLETLAAK